MSPQTNSMDALVAKLQMQFRDHTIALYEQGFLDDQFTELKKLEDDDFFVAEVLSVFFQDCDKLIADMATALEQKVGVDFSKVGASVHKLKGSSSSVGAKKIKGLCVTFKEYCDTQNYQGCVRCLQQVDTECKTFRTKLQHMFDIEKQIIQAGGKVP